MQALRDDAHGEGPLQENAMSRLFRSAVAGALAVCTWSSSVAAAPVCLDTYLIDHTSVLNARTIVFHLKDGSAWQNNLKNACPALRFWGFVYSDRSGLNEICDNQSAVHVINSGETCLLGAFTKVSPVPHA
jgi:hypothetical protein